LTCKRITAARALKIWTGETVVIARNVFKCTRRTTNAFTSGAIQLESSLADKRFAGAFAIWWTLFTAASTIIRFDKALPAGYTRAPDILKASETFKRSRVGAETISGTR
jgi:hypothetical protein